MSIRTSYIGIDRCMSVFEFKYARDRVVQQGAVFPCALQVDVSNPGKYCLVSEPSSYRTCFFVSASKTGDNGNVMLPKNKSNFKYTRRKISVPLAMSTNLLKKVSNFSKIPKKIFPGPILGQDRPEKNSAKC